MVRRKTQEEFIAEAKAKHDSFYDYGKVEYVNTKTKVIVVCPDHGEFKVTPNAHLRGDGCQKCSLDRSRYTQEEILERFRQAHGDRYDYSKVVYTKIADKVTIICPKHGEFNQEAKGHAVGKGCLNCFRESKRLTTKSFIEKAKAKHGEKYDYSKTVYVDAFTKVVVTCFDHGDFEQLPSNHMRGGNCPICARGQITKTRYQFQYKGTLYDSVKHACEEMGKDYALVSKRLVYGWTPAQAFDDEHPPFARPFEVNGVTYNGIADAALKLNSPVSPATIRERIQNGMNVLDALLTPPRIGKEDGLIYVITNLITRKQYVGLTTTTIEERWTHHLSQTRSQNLSLIHKAILEFGKDNFVIESIDHASNIEELKAKEMHWIKLSNTFNPKGYNATFGGEVGGALGKPTQIPGDPKVYRTIRAAAEALAKREGITKIIGSEAPPF